MVQAVHSSPSDRELILTRVIDAPCELVFDVFTDPHHVDAWWGPDGFTNTTLERNVQVGGMWRYIMHGPDGTDYDNRVVYEEIQRPARLSYWHGSDKDDDPRRFHVTVTFEAAGDKTRLTMKMVLPTVEQRREVEGFGAVELGYQTLERFAQAVAARLSSGGNVSLRRILNAPRELVYDAWTKQEHLTRWYAPNGCQVEFRSLDVRPGGTFHHFIQTPTGYQCWCLGEFKELSRPERIVYSLCRATPSGEKLTSAEAGMDPDWPDETIVTVQLIDLGGKTEVRLNQTVRESLARKTGAYPSWLQMLDRLDKEVLPGMP